MQYSHTSDYVYIERALQVRWESFLALEKEFQNFSPRPVSDYDDERSSELERMRGLNPDSTDESLLGIVNGQIDFRASPRVQFISKFNDRIMSEYVTVAFLSHALAEAAINAILAIGLGTSGREDLFALIERADIKEKWTVGPKVIEPGYVLKKDASLFATLKHLTSHRNALVHYKINLEVQGERRLKGSSLERMTLDDYLQWTRRYYSLPYDLANHVRRQMPAHIIHILLDSGPIERYEQ